MTMKKAAAYVRMSTDKQEDSPARQRGEIERYAAANGYSIVEWYEDLGMTGTTSKKRKGFQKLMADAQSRRWQFVLMYEQSRFSREDMLQFASHLHQLREAGVTLVTTLKGEIKTDDLGGVLLTMIDSYNARSESVTIGHRSASGKRRKLIDEGKPNSRGAFGYDRVILDAAGNVLQRVRYNERFQKSPNHQQRLEPNAGAAEAVQWSFDAILSGASLASIARDLNRRGMVTTFGNPWRISNVRHLLTNPVYCGRQRIGQFACGKFARVTDHVIIRDNAHPAIVSEQTFDAAQQILQKKPGRQYRASAYLLSAHLYCGKCGSPMQGNRTRWGRSYRCQFYRLNEPTGAKCKCTVNAPMVERAVWDAIRAHLFSDENLLAADATHQAAGHPESPVQSQIVELQQRIDRAGERLAGDALDDEELGTISRMRREWIQQMRTLRKGLPTAKLNRHSHVPIDQLRELFATIDIEGDTRDLRPLFGALITAIQFDRRGHTDATLRIELNGEYYFGAPIVVNSAEIYRRASVLG